MMKKTLVVLLILSTMTVTFAQDTPEKTKMIGTDLLGLLGGGIIGGFGVFKNDGKNELSFFLFTSVRRMKILPLSAAGQHTGFIGRGKGCAYFTGQASASFP